MDGDANATAHRNEAPETTQLLARPFQWRISVSRPGKTPARETVRLDYIFGLEFPVHPRQAGTRRYFMLEADRGSEPQRRTEPKGPYAYRRLESIADKLILYEKTLTDWREGREVKPCGLARATTKGFLIECPADAALYPKSKRRVIIGILDRFIKAYMPNMEGFEPGLEEVPTTADDQAEREPTATELHERMLNIDLLVQHCNDLLPEDMVRHNVQVILLDEAKRLLKQMHEIEGRTSRDHSANIGSNRPFA